MKGLNMLPNSLCVACYSVAIALLLCSLGARAHPEQRTPQCESLMDEFYSTHDLIVRDLQTDDVAIKSKMEEIRNCLPENDRHVLIGDFITHTNARLNEIHTKHLKQLVDIMDNNMTYDWDLMSKYQLSICVEGCAAPLISFYCEWLGRLKFAMKCYQKSVLLMPGIECDAADQTHISHRSMLDDKVTVYKAMQDSFQKGYQGLFKETSKYVFRTLAPM